MRTFFVLLLVFTAAIGYAQPVPIVKGEDNVQIELRFKNGSTTGKLSKLPSAGYSIPNLGARWLWYSEPCWKTASDCVVTSVTVKTFYKLPLGARYNWTSWWCKVNTAGECGMPTMAAVSVPPGKSLCVKYDRHKAVWEYAPRICTVEDLAVVPPPPPPIPISPDGTWFTTESLSGVILSAQGSWTFGVPKADGNRAILLNGAASGIDGVRLEMIAGKVHTTSKAGVLSQWSGTAWVRISAPPVAVKSPPGDCISAVVGTAYPCLRLKTKIIAADLSEWTFVWAPVGSAKAFRNGIDMKLPYLDATMIYMSNAGFIKAFSPSHLSNNSGYICWNNIVWGTGC